MTVTLDANLASGGLGNLEYHSTCFVGMRSTSSIKAMFSSAFPVSEAMGCLGLPTVPDLTIKTKSNTSSTVDNRRSSCTGKIGCLRVINQYYVFVALRVCSRRSMRPRVARNLQKCKVLL